jgi:DNA repair exonuclease SbcCD nuclease subunit
MGLLLNVHNKTAVLEFFPEKGSSELAGGENSCENAVERIAIFGLCGMPEEIFKEALKSIAFSPVENCFNVFVFHQSLKEASAFGDYATIRDLPAGFDLYVDGHIHLRQDFGEIDGRRVILPGSTVVTQMKRNETEKKGFYIFDTVSRASEFVQIESRPFFFETLEFKGANLSEIESRVRETALKISSASPNAMIKIKLSGSLSSGLLARDVSLANLVSEFEKSGLKLFLDSEFSSQDLKQKIAFLRNLREERAGIRDVGVGMLKDKLKGICEFQLNPEVLFDTLLEGDHEKSFDFLKAENSKSSVSCGLIATN